MNIYISQIYPEAGVSFPFTHSFQQYISATLTAIIPESTYFEMRYGAGYDIIFRMSAKSGIPQPEIKGPIVFAKDKDVEFVIYLPLEKRTVIDDAELSHAISLLLESLEKVFDDHGMCTERLKEDKSKIIRTIMNTPSMIDRK